MPTLAELATELGLDIATFKPEAVTKWNGFLTDAETQYKTAKQLKEDSEANLRQVQHEQTEINDYIEKYGASEQTTAALRANYAAMEAQLKTLKEQGIAVNVPEPVATPTNTKPANVFDADKFADRMGSVVSQSIDASNKYLSLYGKPMPDGLESLASEARQARKTVGQYAAEKYDFAGEEKRKFDAASKAHDEKIAADAVKKYQDANPNVAGNPFMNGGGDSRSPHILKRHDPKDLRAYSNLTPREKIARSVANTTEVLAANQQ